MKRTRRVGSITLGITLMLSGIVYFLNMIFPDFDLMIVIRFWPIILIILGLEVLVENSLAREDEVHYRYDFPAIVMIAVTGLFSMAMAGIELLIRTGLFHFQM